ncbi:MAG: arylsulfatase [Planctomycetes bacterium]|nr:arylsulfatase [Planctomycetota bacterium]
MPLLTVRKTRCPSHFTGRLLHRIATLILLTCAACLSIHPISKAQSAETPRLPNIVFILADDMGYGDPGCYNPESKIPTPNIDSLARDGMRFTDAHSPSAVCSPTRYGVLTGRYSWRTRMKRGVLGGYSRALIDPKRVTVASFLKQHGYATGCVGKWHLGLGSAAKTDYTKPLTPGPNSLGFDYFFGIPASLDMTPYVFVRNERVVALPTEKIAGSGMRRKGGGGFWRGGGIAPGFRHIDVLPTCSQEAVKFIEGQADRAAVKPFFLYFPLSAPHTPWMPTKEFVGKSGAGPYGDFTAQVDWTVGQVVEALKRTKQFDNTLLIVTSDNGAHWLPTDIKKFGHRANGQLRGQKADIHEGGHRVPFIARWPGNIKPGTTSDQTICHTDLLATVAAVIGEKLPNGAGPDSYNILPALVGEAKDRPIREATVHHSVSGMFAIRQGPWKLVLGRGSGGFTAPRVIKPKPGEPKGQLYHLGDDPGEKKNVYLEKPEVVKRLTTLLKRYRTEGHSRPTEK